MAGHSFALIYAPDLVPGDFRPPERSGRFLEDPPYPTPAGPYVVVEQAGPRSKRGVLDKFGDLRIEIQESYPRTSTGVGESIETLRYWHNEIVKLNSRQGIEDR